MDKKRAASDLSDVPEKRRFRVDTLDLFLTGEISGQRAKKHLEHAQHAGAEHVDDLAKSSGASSSNAHRDLLRKALKDNLWPSPYFAEVTGYNPKTGREEQMTAAMFLPHEMIHALLKVNEAGDILRLQQEELRNRRDIQEHLHGFMEEFHVSDVLALGLWVDGVPFNNDRSQSVECVAMNLPALGKDFADLRLPILAYPKFFLAKKKTWDCLFQILAWSFRSLLFDKWPSVRHDASPFSESDSQRKRMVGAPVGLVACLAEVRGDWAMFKDCLNLPGWQGKGHICHKCNIKLAQLGQVSMDAPWRLAVENL